MADLAEPRELLALPAADSINRFWFAVDELGHIGVFQTGDPAAVPDAATPLDSCTSGAFGDHVAPWLAGVDPRALSYAAADIFAEPRSDVVSQLFGKAVLAEPPRFDESLSPALLRLRSRDGARARVGEVGLHMLPSREGKLAWGHLESPVLRELWREGWIMSVVLGHDVEPARLGMFYFEYEAREQSTTEHLYRRWDAPTVPARVEALPTSLRSRLAVTRFVGADFRDRESLHAGLAVGR